MAWVVAWAVLTAVNGTAAIAALGGDSLFGLCGFLLCFTISAGFLGSAVYDCVD